MTRRPAQLLNFNAALRIDLDQGCWHECLRSTLRRDKRIDRPREDRPDQLQLPPVCQEEPPAACAADPYQPGLSTCRHNARRNAEAVGDIDLVALMQRSDKAQQSWILNLKHALDAGRTHE